MADQVEITTRDMEKILQAANESVFRASGAGSFYGQYQQVLKNFDRFGYVLLPPNAEMCGLTFISRPKLNLATSSLRQDRILQTLDTMNDKSLQFMIRCLLDTRFCSRADVAPLAKNSAFFDFENPFITPLTNCLVDMSGWPDPVLDTETTEGGFHSENLTFAKGHDNLSGSYDLTLTFRDIQGGVILALLYTWVRWMGLVTRGNVVPYAEDIDARRLCYTCSIYRFVLDPSKRFITKWAKATGCFPKSVPLGAAFNINSGEFFVSSTAQYSVPFQANKIEYMDPIIFRDFNRLMKRYCKTITDSDRIIATNDARFNFRGLPYIDTYSGRNELQFRCYDDDLVDPLANRVRELEEKLGTSLRSEKDKQDISDLRRVGTDPYAKSFTAKSGTSTITNT